MVFFKLSFCFVLVLSCMHISTVPVFLFLLSLIHFCFFFLFVLLFFFISYIHYPFLGMLTRIFVGSSCVSYLFRHLCFCLMAFSCLFLLGSFIFFMVGPSFVFSDVRSWFCGTCTVCNVCPACEPHLSVSPKCECRENLNNCNCNCITQKTLHTYHRTWYAQFLANQHNIHSAQQNSNLTKRHLLFWIVGLVLFNLLLLVFIVCVLFFKSSLHRCYSQHKFRSALKRRERFMLKHNLIEKPVLQPPTEVSFSTHVPVLAIPSSSPLSDSTVATFSTAPVLSVKPSIF